MKEPVAITEMEFKKSEQSFSEYCRTIDWIISPADEDTVSRTVQDTGARIVVLVTERYSDILYPALSRNARPGPRLIGRYGMGFDGLDLNLRRQHNFMVTITPGALGQSVAEQAMAMLLRIARNIPLLDNEMHQGLYAQISGFELYGKALGIAGFGNIGKKLTIITSQGFGMKINAFDSVPLEKQAAAAELSAEQFLFHCVVQEYFTDYFSFIKSVDILSIHMPVNERTMNYFNAERIREMYPGTVIVNTSQGALIEVSLLPAVVKIVATHVDVPICLDSNNSKAMAAAMEVTAGNPIVN